MNTPMTRLIKLSLFIFLLFTCNKGFAASITAAAGGGNWTTGSTWVGGSAPTAADDALLTSSSGNVTIDSGALCRSIDCNTYSGVLTHNAGATLTIGDGTAGAGNIALRFVAGMTYTINNATTSAISFNSTSGTVQTINFAGKTTGNVTFATAGSWQMTGAHTCGTGATILHTLGTLDVNGQTVSWGTYSSNNSNTRTLTLGAASVAITGTSGTVWNIASGTFTLTTNTAVVTVSGGGVTFSGGGKTYGSGGVGGVVITGSGAVACNNSGGTFHNLTRTGTAAKTDELTLGGNITINTGTLTLNGNSAINRIFVRSNTLGTTRTITLTSATVSASYVDFRDINLSANLSAITGGCGDCGGNVSLTATTSAAQTWQGTSGGSWSDVTKWTSRIPLPQDDVIINVAFSASQTVTADMPRLGRSIDWTGVTGSPTFNINSLSNTLYGSLTLVSGMTLTTGQTTIFEGRSAYTLNAGSLTFGAITQQMIGGTLTLQGGLTSSGTYTLSNGSFDANGHPVTVANFSSSNSNTRTITMGAGLWVLNGTGLVWTTATTTGLTFNKNTANIVVNNTASTTFNGGGLTFNGISYVGGGTGQQVIVGNNTFSDFNVYAPKVMNFTNGSVQTVSHFNVKGFLANYITLNSTVGGSGYTITQPSGKVDGDYLIIQDCLVTGGARWFAGRNSTNTSNNSGWIWDNFRKVIKVN